MIAAVALCAEFSTAAKVTRVIMNWIIICVRAAAFTAAFIRIHTLEVKCGIIHTKCAKAACRG